MNYIKMISISAILVFFPLISYGDYFAFCESQNDFVVEESNGWNSENMCDNKFPESFVINFYSEGNLINSDDSLESMIEKLEKNDPYEKQYWRTLTDIEVDIGTLERRSRITIPSGFKTDLFSFDPLRDDVRVFPAAVLHDYLFWVQPCEKRKVSELGRKIANKLFKRTLKEYGYKRFLANVLKKGVQVGDKIVISWEKNRESRDHGETRFEYNSSNYDEEIVYRKGSVCICDVFPKWTDPCQSDG